jgi:hypothetical protein
MQRGGEVHNGLTVGPKEDALTNVNRPTREFSLNRANIVSADIENSDASQ